MDPICAQRYFLNTAPKTFFKVCMNVAGYIRNILYVYILDLRPFFFCFSGIANLYVAYNFSTEFWVNFKVYGLLGLTFIFAIAQAMYMSQHIKDINEEKK